MIKNNNLILLYLINNCEDNNIHTLQIDFQFLYVTLSLEFSYC